MSGNMTYSEKPWQNNYFMGPFKLKKTMAPYPKINIYQFLVDSAEKYPDQVALVYLDTEITYSSFKNKVDKFASALTDLSVSKGDMVATVLPTCPQFVIADYAIMALGAIHVPLSILHKIPELEYELAKSKPKVVICSSRRVERIIPIKEKIGLTHIIHTPVPIFPDYQKPELDPIPGTLRMEDLIADHEPNFSIPEINPEEDLALMPFTGGTTGKPKATMLSHYNITTNVIQTFHWFMKPLEVALKGKTSFLVCVPIFHTYGHWVVHAAISWGLKLLLVDARDIDQIAMILKKERPFAVFGVPTHYMELLQRDLKKSQTMFFSGAAPLPPDLAKKFHKKVGVPMSEGYGMTETSAATHVDLSAISKVTGYMLGKSKEGSIGVPVPDTEIKLVDPGTGEEVPIGEPGEVWINGPQIMQGYFPETGKGLEPDGWLRTGDIAKMDEDGYFWIVDRIKDMVNVSGMKVYSQTVEEILYEHPGVRMAGVIGIPDPKRPGSERVKAIIVPKEGHEISEREIFDFCQERLPPYAVPREVDFRFNIPLTRILKIDKKKLREEELKKH